MSKKYKITVIEFDGEGESLKAASLYEQTLPAIDIRAIINAVNLPTDPIVNLLPAPRKRATRSDKGTKRSKAEEASDFVS